MNGKNLTLEDANPCPFCGSKSLMRITSSNDYYMLRGMYGSACICIECMNCSLSLYNHDYEVQKYEPRVDALVRKWNRLSARGEEDETE